MNSCIQMVCCVSIECLKYPTDFIYSAVAFDSFLFFSLTILFFHPNISTFITNLKNIAHIYRKKKVQHEYKIFHNRGSGINTQISSGKLCTCDRIFIVSTVFFIILYTYITFIYSTFIDFKKHSYLYLNS